MDERVLFTSGITATTSFLHSSGQSNLKQCATSSRNSAVMVGDRLLVSQANKALINVYIMNDSNKKESVEQRLPLPELISCIAVVENNNAVESNCERTNVDLPYLLLASTPSGKLYIWELASGKLLCVKPMSHYQTITKIQAIVNGKYVVTSGADARLIVWQTSDLVLQDEPKPVYMLHDHTLAITDFAVSNAHNSDYLNTKLFTVSEDMSLRCYQLSNAFERPQLLNTFTFPVPLTSVALDSADRCVYVGTTEGVYALPTFYHLDPKGSKIVNLLQLGENKILSITESQEGMSANRQELFQMGTIVCDKIYPTQATTMQVSMDGSLLVVGNTLGSCSVIDIYSKQIMKELAPLVTKDAHLGPVNNLMVIPCIAHSESLTQTGVSGSQSAKVTKIPNLEKAIYDREDMHNLMFQKGRKRDPSPILPVSDFEKYIDNVAQEESVFMQLGAVNSTLKVVGEQLPSSNASSSQDTSKDAEVATLKETVQQLTAAYKDLREIHEKLYEDHEKLLQKHK
ncbi:HBR515Wp [Eremothecium sinecaudum]|uniref:Pre-rRNA-processing protein IPI3 n=1 Tax=Eremothecium sinecaudum TaxID=45286 RepID=A0A109UVQ0_9SACH|nr:HBR515Wp [Eremothecium sinecaudum]AMD19416.1 HBR515Wp [Eremothecium sinecaudum]